MLGGYPFQPLSCAGTSLCCACLFAKDILWIFTLRVCSQIMKILRLPLVTVYEVNIHVFIKMPLLWHIQHTLYFACFTSSAGKCLRLDQDLTSKQYLSSYDVTLRALFDGAPLNYQVQISNTTNVKASVAKFIKTVDFGLFASVSTFIYNGYLHLYV